MKKNLSRVTAILLVLVMCLSMAATAWAADVEPEAELTQPAAEVQEEETEQSEVGEVDAEPEPAETIEIEVPAESEEEPAEAVEEPAEESEETSEADADVEPDTLAGICGDHLIWRVSPCGQLTISGIGAMYDYSDSKPAPWSWLENKDVGSGISSVVVSEGVTGIGAAAFLMELELTKVTLPATLLTIGDMAFGMCMNLEEVTIPRHVTKIGDDAFACCMALKEISVPASVRSIGKEAFAECYAAKSVTLNSGLTKVGESAFLACSEVKTVTVPDSVTEIGDYAFGYDYLVNCKGQSAQKRLKAMKSGRREDLKKISDFSLTGSKGSAAEKYASDNGITFVPVGSSPEKPDKPVKLDAPVLVSAENKAKGVYVKWKSVKGAACYHVSRKQVGADKWFGVGDTSKTTFTDTTAVSGRKYVYTVRCISAPGGAFTSGYDPNGLTIQYLARPVVTDIENRVMSVKVSWKKVPGAAAYRVYRDAGTGYKLLSVALTNSYVDTYAKSNGKAYKYRVRAYNGNFSSQQSAGATNYWVERTKVTAVVNGAAGKVTAKWQANTASTGYQLEYATKSDFSNAKRVVIGKKETVSRTISNLTVGKTCYVRVRVRKNVSGKNYFSAWSAVKSVKVTK